MTEPGRRDERRALPIAEERPAFVRTRYTPEILAAIAEGESKALAPIVRRGPEGAIEAAGVASARAAELVSVAMEREPPGSPFACRRGCSTCCQAKVLVVAPEVLRIAAFLRANRTPEELDSLVSRVRDVDARTRGLSRAARAEAHVPCPLLAPDGGCGVHEVRPLVCRSWTSYDASLCERYWEADARGPTPPQWPQGYEITQAVLAGLGKACFDVSKDGAPLELVRALVIALERPSAGRRWHEGLPVFSTARDAEWASANARGV